MNVKFIDYNTMEEAYTVPELCQLLKISEPTLRKKCIQYSIYSVRTDDGKEIFLKAAACHLHNILYHKSKNRNRQKRGRFQK